MTNLFNESDASMEYMFKQYSMFVASAEKNSERRTHLNRDIQKIAKQLFVRAINIL